MYYLFETTKINKRKNVQKKREQFSTKTLNFSKGKKYAIKKIKRQMTNLENI